MPIKPKPILYQNTFCWNLNFGLCFLSHELLAFHYHFCTLIALFFWCTLILTFALYNVNLQLIDDAMLHSFKAKIKRNVTMIKIITKQHEVIMSGQPTITKYKEVNDILYIKIFNVLNNINSWKCVINQKYFEVLLRRMTLKNEKLHMSRLRALENGRQFF